MENSSLFDQNIISVAETNWSISPNKSDIWYGELPFKEGDQFPTEEVKERAMVSKTNRLIFDNDVDTIYSNIISIFPEIDPMYGWQVREIITNLPYFKNATNGWVSLIAASAPLVDSNEDYAQSLSQVVEDSNFADIIQTEVRSRFLDEISAYRVDINPLGKPHITCIDTKNLMVFVDEQIPSFIRVVVIFSIYNNEEGKFIDFVEYHFDGRIVKSTFSYDDNSIGMLVDRDESEAFEGKFKASPVVVFQHNTNGNDVYGTDQYRYWSASMLGAMRGLQNVLRLGERTREMIRKVPESAIQKNEADGSSVFFNKGTVSYPDGAEKSPDIEYVVPEVRIVEALKALEASIKQVGIDTQLGLAFYDASVLGSRISADSIKASMFSTVAEAKRMTTEMMSSVKELVVRLGYTAGLDVSPNKISVTFYDGFPVDETEVVKEVQSRLDPNNQSITLEDAIMKLDKVPLRVAREKAKEIRREQALRLEVLNGNNESVIAEASVEKIEDEENNNVEEQVVVESSELKPSGGSLDEEDVNDTSTMVDDTVWDNQMFPAPRDIPPR